MKLLVILTLFLALGATAPQSNQLPFRNIYKEGVIPPNHKPSPRIIGGKEAKPNSIPYQVYMEIYSETFIGACGGSLISTKFVLTAAHCLVGINVAHMTLGAHKSNAIENTAVVAISKTFKIHEAYDSNLHINDVGLVKLIDGLKVTNAIGVIPLADNPATSYSGKTARISGWGITNTGARSATLRYVDVTVMTNNECARYFTDIPDTNVCTSGAQLGGACNGDSGGPLVYQGELIGVVSFGFAGCPLGAPSAFARVTHYKDWITNTMAEM